MIRRLIKVTDGLYRGSAPNPQDVLQLQNDFGIKKIVSLDKETGEKIDRTCKILGIKHVMVPIDFSKKSLYNFLTHDLKELLIDGGPTFVHCHEGKDRTGLAVAMFKCKYMGMDPKDAIKEAKSLGFGIGVNPEIISLFEKLIKACKPVTDINKADIVSNTREHISDNRTGPLDEANQGSFAPNLSGTKQYPLDLVYNEINNQSPTRENYPDKSIKEHEDKGEKAPLVGQYNNGAGIEGAGPTLNTGGFFSE